MKKVLATVAALGLVFGVAANAMALDKPARASEAEEPDTQARVPAPTAPGVALWSVAGQWVLAGAYLDKGYGGPGGAAVNGAPGASNDAFYVYSFKILPVLQVNDKIAMKGELRFVDRGVLGATDLGQSTNMKLYTVYMEWTSPYGKTRFGRTPAGAWGTSKFNDSTRQGQRLMWWPNMMPENWSSLIFTEKLNEQDAGVDNTPSGTDGSGPYVSDSDTDAYYIGLSYKADIGPTNGALWIVRNASSDEGSATTSPYTSANLWLNGKYNFDSLVFEWEADWGFGESSSINDQNTLALMADLGWKTGDFTLGGLFLYCSGDNNAADDESESACANSKGTGRDFNPYQIMMGDYMNLWNADNPLAGNSIHPSLITPGGNVGLWSLGAYGKYTLLPLKSQPAGMTNSVGKSALAWATSSWTT
jgi:hypothetical protein